MTIRRWILLRGLAREAGHWYEFPERFASRVAPATVHALDLPGAGTQRHNPGALSVPGIARQLLPRCTATVHDPSESWAIVGTSLGAMVALQLAIEAPVAPVAVVAINPSSQRSAPWARLRLRALVELLRIATQQGLTRERAIVRLTSQLPQQLQERYALRANSIATRRPMARGAALRQLVAASRFAPPAPSALPCPVLVLRSLQDRLVHPECAAQLAEWYGAKLCSHPWGGHDLPLDDPQWICDRVAEWLPELENASISAP